MILNLNQDTKQMNSSDLKLFAKKKEAVRVKILQQLLFMIFKNLTSSGRFAYQNFCIQKCNFFSFLFFFK